MSLLLALAENSSLVTTLDYNFAATGVLPATITFARALAATYVNSAGVLSTASSGVARFDYDPTTLVAKGLLRENAATNLTLHSDMASGWAFTSASFTQGAATGPDGVAGSAVKLVEAAATSPHFGGIGSLAIVAGSTNTYSEWLKAAERSTAQLQFTDGAISTGFRGFFNLATGVVTSTSTLGTGTITGSGVKAYPNGWYRCWITGIVDAATTTSARTTIQISNSSYAGDGTSGILCYGSQPEAGSLATSYIPTTTATVTRPADTITAAVSGLGYSTTVGTLAINFIPQVVGATNVALLELNDGSAANRIQMRIATSTALPTFLMVASSVTSAQFSGANAAIANVLNRQAMTWALADDAIILNGGNNGVPATSAAGTPLPTGITTLRIGDSASAGQGFSGWIPRLRYDAKRNVNSVLVGLSTGAL